MTTPAFYVREDDHFLPTDLVPNPWIAGAQSGVALAGLVTHILGAVPDPAPMITTRLMIDIMGVVPLGPVETAVRIDKEGRRLRFVTAELVVNGIVRVRATALRMRIAESLNSAMPLAHPLPAGTEERLDRSWFESFRLAGSYDLPGPGARWMRMTGLVVAGEPLDPISPVAIFADFGTGTAPLVSHKEWTFANVDIGIYCTRLPIGEWLLLDAFSESAGNGIGVTSSRIGDRLGMFASAHQTSFLNRR